ncbi:ribonuclease H-like domain-containing protein [Tanacetum coccineum]
METNNTSSSGSDLKEPEIQKLQMQAKNLKENSLNKLNALKTTIHTLSSLTTQCTTSLEKLFTDSLMRMKDFSGQFEHFIHSKMFELSKYNTNAREIVQDFNAYTTMEAQTFKETIIQNMDSIAQCMVERASHEQALLRDETSSGIVSDEEIDKKELEAHWVHGKIKESLTAEIKLLIRQLEQVQNNDENNVFSNERQHSENNTAESDDERAALANLITNLTLDTEENKMILKQLKKANASLTQELEECKTNLDETSRALGEATSCQDSCLITLQNKQNELEKYIAFNDRTIDYDILQTKLNETLGLLARKDIDIKEGLKTKAYEISVVNQKHDELVKRSLLTKSQFEGQLKEKSKVISDLKVKEEKYIDKMIEMDKQLMFLNEIIYTRNQSIQTIQMLAPKCLTFNGRPTFANPRYLKKSQSEKPCLYEIPYDTSDLANRFEEGIEHQTSTPRTPEQNGVVERRNRTLVEAARTMLSASKLPLSFWAEAVATAMLYSE